MRARTVPASTGQDFTVGLRADGSVTISRGHSVIKMTRQDVSNVFREIHNLTKTSG